MSYNTASVSVISGQIINSSMGCSHSQDHKTVKVDKFYEQKLLSIMRYEKKSAKQNINEKYLHLQKINMKAKTGHGFKQTFQYQSLVSKQELDRERQEFWDTRTSGGKNIWKAIRTMIEDDYDEQRAYDLAFTNRFKLIGGSVQIGLDQKLQVYQVPIFCINHPTSYSAKKEVDRDDFVMRELEIIFQSAKFGKVTLHEISNESIEDLKESLKQEVGLVPETRMRFFYNGKQLKDSEAIGSYDYESKSIIQVVLS